MTQSKSNWPNGTRLSVKKDTKTGNPGEEWILPKGATGTATGSGYWVKLDHPINGSEYVSCSPTKFELIVPFETILWALE